MKIASHPLRLSGLSLDRQFLLLSARQAGKEAKTWILPVRFPLGAAVFTSSGKVLSGHKYEGPHTDPSSSYEALDCIKKSLGKEERIVLAAFVGPVGELQLSGMCQAFLDEHKVKEIYFSDSQFYQGVYVVFRD